MLFRFLSNMLGLFALVGFGLDAQTLPFTPTTAPGSSGTYPAGAFYRGCTSQTSDPLGPFNNNSVMFLGWQAGGSSETLNGAHLVYRFQIQFPQAVQLNSITVVGSGDYNSGGSSAVLRLLDQDMNVIGSLSTSNLNSQVCPNTYTLNVSGVSGQTFFVDEFDYSTNMRFRQSIAMSLGCQVNFCGQTPTASTVGCVSPVASGAVIQASFTPGSGLSLDAAAKACGFLAFDWVQIIDQWPSPSYLFSESNQTTPIAVPPAPPPYDPPLGGYYYQYPWNFPVGSPAYTKALVWADDQPNFATAYPFYYSPLDLPSGIAEAPPIGPGLPIELPPNTLNFYDSPKNPCIPFGALFNSNVCQTLAGAYMSFTTQLVGVLSCDPSSTLCSSSSSCPVLRCSSGRGTPTSMGARRLFRALATDVPVAFSMSRPPV
jgi:hypothetical protein